MSYEAWGDGDDDDGYTDRLIEAGWMSPDEVEELKAEQAALVAKLREQIAVLQDTNEGLMSTLMNFNKLRWWEKARWKW